MTVAILGSVGVARWQDWRIRQRERETANKEREIGRRMLGTWSQHHRLRRERAARSLPPRAKNDSGGAGQGAAIPVPRAPSLPFVLDNAHLLPGNAIIDVPQLLSLRELAVNNIQTGLSPARGSNDRVLVDEEVRVITKLLGWMQKLIADIYGQLEAIHETSITQLLEQELRPKSRRRS